MTAPFPSFEVIPAVDVQDGEVVQLVAGERGTEKRYGEPQAAADQWLDEGAETLHLVDLDGAFEGERVNSAAFETLIATTAVDLQIGGGIRTAEDAVELLDLGVDRVILGTAAVENPDIVAEISERYPGSVMVSLDAKDGEVVVSGWTESTGLDPAEAAGRYEELGAGAILFTDVDVEGQLEGVNTDLVSRSATRSTFRWSPAVGSPRSATFSLCGMRARRRLSSAPHCTRARLHWVRHERQSTSSSGTF